MEADKTDVHCGVCDKPLESIKVLTEVHLEIFSKYVREDGTLENINGLWRHTQEYMCEECFKKYAKTLENFYQSERAVLKTKLSS